MKALLTTLFVLLSGTAMAIECDQNTPIPLSTSEIMNRFDDFYDRQSECISIKIRLNNNQFCTAHVKVRMIEDPLSEAPEFSVTRCSKTESNLL
jgi:hypothetical protein